MQKTAEMGFEIERKFLVVDDSYLDEATSESHILQTYLSTLPSSTVRVRTVDSKGFLTVKGLNNGAVRHEWEYEIPESEAREMMERCAVSPIIEKTRYRCGRWEIDCFHGSLEGLTVAEIELSNENEPFVMPSFIGMEVTGDSRYYNSSLSTLGLP